MLCLATGRTLAGAKPVSDDLGLQTPMILQNGGIVLAEDHQTILHRETIQRDGYENLLHLLPKTVAAFVCDLHDGDIIYYNSPAALERLLARYPLHEHVFRYRPRLERCMQPVRILLMGEEEEMDAIEELLPVMAGDQVRIIHWGDPDADFAVAEIVPSHVSKATAAQQLIRYLDVPREQVVALGDQFNDIELLAWAGLGIAMGDAPPEVQQAAAMTTLSSDEDGAAIAIEQFVLNAGKIA